MSTSPDCEVTKVVGYEDTAIATALESDCSKSTDYAGELGMSTGGNLSAKSGDLSSAVKIKQLGFVLYS